MSSRQNNTTLPVLIQVNWYYSARFWLSFGVGGLFVNSLEALAILYNRKHKTIFGLTLISLCIGDILGSICFIFAGALRLLEYDGPEIVTITTGSHLAVGWKAGHATLFFSVGSSFAHIVFIAAQRLFATFLPIRFKTGFTYKRCKWLLLFTWVMFFTCGVTGFFYPQGLLTASYYLILVVGAALVFLYSALCYKARMEANKRKLLASRSSTSIEKTVLLSLSITIAFLVCTYLNPVFYLFVLQVEDLTFYHFVNSIISANPMLDGVIYFCFYHSCRRERDKQVIISSPGTAVRRVHRTDAIPLRKLPADENEQRRSVPSLTI